MKSSKHSSPYSNRLALFRRPTKVARAVALAAMVSAASLPFIAFSVQAGTADTFTSGTALLTPSNWSLLTVPTAANDAIFGPSSPNSSLTLTAGTITAGSLNDTHTGVTTTITNGTSGTTPSMFILGGGATVNAVSGSAPADLIYVAGAASTVFNINPGTSASLNIGLAQSGNFNVGAGSVLNTGVGLQTTTLALGSFTLTTTGAGTQNIGNVITGGGAVVIAGGGTVTLGNQNTYSGGTTVNAGSTLVLNTGNSTSKTVPTSGTFTDNGSLIFSVSSNVTYNSAVGIGGSGTITKIGLGNTTLSAANTYTGATIINAGDILFSNTAALSTSGITINSGGGLIAGGAGNSPYGGTVQGYLTSGKIVNSSAGAIAIGTSTNAEAVDFTVGGGYNNLYLGNSVTTTFTGTIVPGTNGYLVGGGSTGSTLAIANGLSGTSSLTTGGLVDLRGANTYSGGTNIATSTTVLSGTLNPASLITISGPAALRLSNAGATVSNTVVDNGILAGFVGAGTTVTASGNISGSGSVVSNAAGTFILSGTNSYTGTTGASAGTIKAGSSGAFPTTSALVFNTSNPGSTIDLGGFNQSSPSLSTTATTTLVQSYTVTNGTLTLTGATDLTLATSNTTSTSRFDLSGLSAFTYNHPANNVRFDNNNAGASPGAITDILLSKGTNTITALSFQVGSNGVAAGLPLPTVVADLGAVNTLNIGGTATTGGITVGGYKNNGTLDFQAGLTNPTVTIRGLTGGVSSVGGLFQVAYSNGGSGGVTGIADFSGTGNNGTVDAIVGTLNIGVLNVTNPLAVNGTFTMASGIVNVNNLTLATESQINSVAGSASINATFNQNEGTVLANTITFNKNTTVGSPTNALTFTSNYNLGTTGGLAGTLSAATIGIGALGNATTTAASVANLNFNNGTISTYDPTLAQAGFAGSNGNPTTAGNLTINGTGTTAATTLNVVLASTGTHNFLATAGHTLTVGSNAVISGGGALTANGPGNVILNGTNTYSGGTNVTNGTLTAGNTSAFGSATAPVTVNGGTLDIATFSPTVGIVTLSNGTIQSTGSTTATLFGSSYAVSAGNATAILGGTGTLTKSGAGTVTLSAANTYTGATTINGGTLLVNGSTAAASAVTVGDGAGNNGTLGGTGTVNGGATVNAGSIITGATAGTMGTLTLASLAVNGGTYQFDPNSMSATGGDLLALGAGALTGANGIINVTGTLDGTSTYVIANYGSDPSLTVFTTLTGTANYAILETANALELVPVPEPSTYVGGLVLVAALGWSVRGRFNRRSV